MDTAPSLCGEDVVLLLNWAGSSGLCRLLLVGRMATSRSNMLRLHMVLLVCKTARGHCVESVCCTDTAVGTVLMS